MTISFTQIPSNLLVPGSYTEVNGNRAASSTPVLPRRLFVVGQKLTAGEGVNGQAFRCFSESDADRNGGTGSMLAEMLRVIKASNRFVELWGVPVADGSAATSASCTITVAATSAVAGSLAVYVSQYWVGSQLRGRYTVAVTASESAASIATKIAAAITADPYRQVSAAAVGAVVTLTARHAGIAGNHLVASHSYYEGERLPTGVTLTITAMSGGAVNPDLGPAIAAMGDAHSTHFVSPYTDATSLTSVETEATRRWGGTVQRETHVFCAARGTLSALTTLGDGRNSPHLSIVGHGFSPTPPWIAASDMAAVDAAEFHPGRPLRGRLLASVVAPRAGLEFLNDERQQLLGDGISTVTFDASGKCRVERLVTTYQTDDIGTADSKYRDRQVLGLLAAIRWDWRTHIATKYPDYMHAADGVAYAPGLPIVTPSTMRAEFSARARQQWAKELGWIENPDQFDEDIIVERTEDGMDLIGAPDLINRLHITRTRFDFIR